MDPGVFVSRAEAETTTLKELFERHLAEITPRNKGAASEANRLRALMRLPLARRYVAGIRGMDIACFRQDGCARSDRPPSNSIWRSLRQRTGKYREPSRRRWRKENGGVDGGAVLLCASVVVGTLPQTVQNEFHGAAGPAVAGIPAPDTVIGCGELLRIQRKSTQ
ncbi:MAG: hypothetical protein R3F42_02285 [Pseudomonadota bacterium]